MFCSQLIDKILFYFTFYSLLILSIPTTFLVGCFIVIELNKKPCLSTNAFIRQVFLENDTKECSSTIATVLKNNKELGYYIITNFLLAYPVFVIDRCDLKYFLTQSFIALGLILMTENRHRFTGKFSYELLCVTHFYILLEYICKYINIDIHLCACFKNILH